MLWRTSRLGIWRLLASLVASAVGLILIVLTPGLANAVPPTRQPNPLPTEPFIFTDTVGNNPCSFPVLLDITTNKEIVTTFTRRSGVTSIHTTGALKVRLTNTDTGKTIDRNISGPILATVNSDGSLTQKGAGPALWVFDPGVAPELPRLVITKGKTESILGPGTAFSFISRQGSFEDICGALGA
jgi:ribosomal protein S28E/S33